MASTNTKILNWELITLTPYLPSSSHSNLYCKLRAESSALKWDDDPENYFGGMMPNASIQQTAQLLGRTPDQRFERLMPGYTDRLQAKRIETKPPQSSWAFKILVIKIGVFLVFAAIILYAAAVFYGGFVAKDGRSNSTQLQQITIGSDVLTLPENLIRFSNQRDHPNLERLDLFAHWPSN